MSNVYEAGMEVAENIRPLIHPDWWSEIEAGMAAGHPARLPEWPLRLPLEAITVPNNFMGRGLGHDVYRIPDSHVVIKVAMNRDQRAIAESFIDNQCESYLFWQAHMGDKFMPPTVMFAYPHPDRPGNRGCEMQMLVNGRPLWQMTSAYLRDHHWVAHRLRLMIQGILKVFRNTGRLPDVAGCHFSAPIGVWLLRSARLTSNLRLDANDWPWMVDVGAWPQGFSVRMAPAGRRLLLYKWALDLRLFYSELGRYATNYTGPE